MIVGLPVTLAARRASRPRLSRAFAEQLTNLLDVPVEVYDERLDHADGRPERALRRARRPRFAGGRAPARVVPGFEASRRGRLDGRREGMVRRHRGQPHLGRGRRGEAPTDEFGRDDPESLERERRRREREARRSKSRKAGRRRPRSSSSLLSPSSHRRRSSLRNDGRRPRRSSDPSDPRPPNGRSPRRRPRNPRAARRRRAARCCAAVSAAVAAASPALPGAASSADRGNAAPTGAAASWPWRCFSSARLSPGF